MLEQLLARTHGGAKDERELITEAFGIFDTVKKKAGDIRSDQRLSKAGISAKLVEALGPPWERIGQLRDKAKTMAADIEAARSRMVPKPLDPTDVVGAIRQSDMQKMMLAATRGERLHLARNNNDFAIAALSAPAELSGFGKEPVVEGQPSDLDLVRTAFQQRNFPELYAGVQLREETHSTVVTALEIVTKQICAEVGVQESEIDHLTSKEDVTEVDPNNLPQITRADLNAWSKADPARAAAEMRKVYEGKATLVAA